MSNPPPSPPLPRDLVIRIALVLWENGPELDPPVWRQVKLSAHLTLDVVHDKVLVPCMGWTRNYHTYFFTCGNKKWLYQDTNATDLVHAAFRNHNAGMNVLLDPKDATLGNLLEKVGDKVMYTYDLVNGWHHGIELKEIISETESNGKCLVLAGEMRCPDEDGKGGCVTYQEDVLNPVLMLRMRPHEKNTARVLAKHCFDRRNALNVRGRFDPNEFTVQEAMAAVNQALASRASSMVGTKHFLTQFTCVTLDKLWLSPVNAGQRIQVTMVEDDRGGNGFLRKMVETINFKPDDCSHTACPCGNPLNLKACIRCKSVYYCSVECEQNDLKQGDHGKVCKKENEAREKYEAEKKMWSTKRPADLEITGKTIPLVKFRDTLRFKKGDVVECILGDQLWATGVIVDTMYREDHWPRSRPSAPYQIQLERFGRRLIFASWDDDYQVRKLPDGEPLSPEITQCQMEVVDFLAGKEI